MKKDVSAAIVPSIICCLPTVEIQLGIMWHVLSNDTVININVSNVKAVLQLQICNNKISTVKNF